MKFWLEAKQVDGLRIDAVKFMFEREDLQDEPLILENLNKPVFHDFEYEFNLNKKIFF